MKSFFRYKGISLAIWKRYKDIKAASINANTNKPGFSLKKASEAANISSLTPEEQ